MRRGMAGAGILDRAPIASTQRGRADVKAAMRAQGSRDRSNLLRRCQSGGRGVGCASVLAPEAHSARRIPGRTKVARLCKRGDERRLARD